ncbi:MULTISPECIES: hypothetical protein [unclassified Arthrobacter]|nr:hypothetical protein [Arthrobacter sp. MAHUQ-56]MBX7444935.1 hypothetical protein [Arthrobacter sp. MAHUQ-56]
MAITDYVLALCALMGTLLVPFVVLCQLLRRKRRALRFPARPTPHSIEH